MGNGLILIMKGKRKLTSMARDFMYALWCTLIKDTSFWFDLVVERILPRPRILWVASNWKEGGGKALV